MKSLNNKNYSEEKKTESLSDEINDAITFKEEFLIAKIITRIFLMIYMMMYLAIDLIDFAEESLRVSFKNIEIEKIEKEKKND